MGFKLPGRSIQTGTSGHSSALKMVSEQRAASALKMTASPAKSPEYDAAAKNDSELGKYVKDRKSLKKGSKEYSDNQYKINKAYYGEEKAKGIQSKYDAKNKISRQEFAEAPKKETTTVTGDAKDNKIITEGPNQNASKITDTKKESKASVKDSVKKSEIDENAKVRKAKEAKNKTEKGSVERTDAKIEVSKAKGEDLAGKGGGKKAKLFGNIRRKLNKNKTTRLEKKSKKERKNTSSGNLKGSLANDEVKGTTKRISEVKLK